MTDSPVQPAPPRRDPPSLGLHPLILQPATFPPFDTYVRVGEDAFRLFLPDKAPVYVSTCQKLRKQGTEMLYVRGEDEPHCLDYLEQHLPAVLAEEDVPSAHLAGWLYRLCCRAMHALLKSPGSPQACGRVQSLVRTVARIIKGDAMDTWRVLQAAPQDYTTHSHSINVCVLLTGFARRVLGIEDGELLGRIAVGGALHDVGKCMIRSEILEKPAGLTLSEFAEVRKHPAYGLDIARPYLEDDPIARSIIAQHHEDDCGSGYPEGRAGESINIFARATRVADVFDALTCNRPYAQAMDYGGALSVMTGEMRERFDRSILGKFVNYLGAISGHRGPTRPALAAARRPAPARDLPPGQAPTELLVPVESAAAEAVETELPAEPVPCAEDTVCLREDETTLAFADPPAERGAAAARASGAGGGPDRLSALLGCQEENARLMVNIMAALRGAVENIGLREAGQVSLSILAEGAAEPSSVARAELARARGIFPLVWELDAWRFRLQAQGDRASAEALAHVRTVRDGLVRFLRTCGIDIVEVPEGRTDPPEGVAGQMWRPGFVLRTDQGSEMLEPPRVVLYPGMRKAAG